MMTDIFSAPIFQQLFLFADGDGLGAAAAKLGNTTYYVLAGYLVLLLVLGIVGWMKSSAGEEDYYLAGRGQGWVISSVTIMATFFSAFALIGAPAMVYREGLMFALFSLNVPVAGVCVYLLGSRILKVGRRFGYVTPGDMVSDYYGSKHSLRLLVAVTSVLYIVPYVVMQIKAGGVLSEQLFPQAAIAWDAIGGRGEALFQFRADSFEIGCTILASITMIYIMVGGMRSVAWTDLIQGVMLISGMMLCGFAMLLVFNGPANFSHEITTKLPETSLTLPANTGGWHWPKIFTICLLVSTGSMVQPAQWMRYYSAKSVQTLRRGAVIFAVVLTTCFILGVMLIGIAGQILYPLTFTVSQEITAGEELPKELKDEKSAKEFAFLATPKGQAKPTFGYVRDKDDANKATISWSWAGKNKQAVIPPATKQELLKWNNSEEYQKAVEALQKKVAKAHSDDPTSSESVRPEPSAHPSIKDYDAILVATISSKLPEQFPLWGAFAVSLILVAILASAMSTSDSNLHALSAVATRDIYDHFIRPKATEGERVWVGRIVIAIATCVALVVVIGGRTPEFKENFDVLNMVAKMGMLAAAFSGQLLPIVLDMLFFRKGSGKGAAAGLTAGLLATFFSGELFGMFSKAIGSPSFCEEIIAFVKMLSGTLNVHSSFWGLIVNIPVFVLVSLMTRKPDPEKVQAYAETFAERG